MKTRISRKGKSLYWEFSNIPDIRNFVAPKIHSRDETSCHPRVLEEEAEKTKEYREEVR